MDTAELEREWDLLAGPSAGRRKAAREERAFKRMRKIQDPDVLLRLILLHAGAGLSLRQASAWAKMTGLAMISDVARRGCDDNARTRRHRHNLASTLQSQVAHVAYAEKPTIGGMECALPDLLSELSCQTLRGA
jgi:hypothetical protein